MEKSDELDLELLFDVFDQALTSDNPLVKEALTKLILATALTTEHGRKKSAEGPLKKLLLMVQHMDGRISQLEREKWIKKPETNWDQAKKWVPPKI